jgi:hypothetical protein
MTLAPITFAKACKAVQKAVACIVDDNALTYPVINEDFDGNDCIEANYYTEDGLVQNTFDNDAKYFVDEKGRIIIHQDNQRYSLQFLAFTSPILVVNESLKGD